MPANLARLHASVSHYSSNQHHYEVKVLCASSPEEAIRFSRRVVEETHRASKVPRKSLLLMFDCVHC